MKRLLVIFLICAILGSLVSCSSTLSETEGTLTQTVGNTETGEKPESEKDPVVLPQGFSAGFGRCVVNPEAGTSLGGYASAENRLSTVVLDDIMLTCTALSDGENVFLFYSTDSLYVKDTTVNTVTKKLENYFEGIRIPPENIVMNATHTHSAPILHYSSFPGMSQYLRMFYDSLWEITEEALRDLAPASLSAGETQMEGLNFVRRYVTLDGKTYLGGTSMEGGQDPAKVRHETEADRQMQVLKFHRETKKDILMVNWQCHPCSNGIGAEGSTKVSADWVGALRFEVEKDLDVLFIYQQGAAGNLVSTTKIKGEKNNSDYKAKGKELAKCVADALENETPLETGPFRANRIVYTAKCNERYQREQGGGKTENLYLSALSMGDVAFGTFPCELHDTLGQYVKENSPSKVTFVCAYTNGTVSYVPSTLAFDNGGYEADMFRFERGMGEDAVKTVVEMIQNL